MTYLTDPDVERFRSLNHDIVTICEGLDCITGWRLCCVNCGLLGERLYQDLEEIRAVSRSLRCDDTPECAPHREPDETVTAAEIAALIDERRAKAGR